LVFFERRGSGELLKGRMEKYLVKLDLTSEILSFMVHKVKLNFTHVANYINQKETPLWAVKPIQIIFLT